MNRYSLCSIASNYRKIWCPSWPMTFVAPSIVQAPVKKNQGVKNFTLVTN